MSLYINKTRRAFIDGTNIRNFIALTKGELTYAISKLMKNYLDSRKDVNDEAINDILGSIEMAKLEFHRRVVAPYADGEAQEYGDVY